MRRQIAVAMFIIAALSGCSGSPSGQTPASNRPNDPSQSVDGGSTIKPVPVTQLWHPGDFQNGIQVYWHTTGTEQQIQSAADRTFDFVVGLGANSVGLTFPIYTDGAYPTRVYAGPDTPSVANLNLAIQAAQARGLRVELRPTIDEKNIAVTTDAWRGSILPADPSAWLHSYAQFLRPYVRLAKHYQLPEFVVGTELTSLQDQTSAWQRLQASFAATGYFGKLTYTYNWNGVTPVPFKVVGIDAYPSLSVPDNASVAVLSHGMEQWFTHLPGIRPRQLVAQEVGIAAVDGMYLNPWELGTSSSSLDPAVQAHWFSAMCQATHAAQMQGLYFWMLDSNVDPSNPGDQPPTSWLGRPGQASIHRCFAH